MAKKYMSLLVSLDKADLDRMKKTVKILRWVLLRHVADCSTNGLYGKEHRAQRYWSISRLEHQGISQMVDWSSGQMVKNVEGVEDAKW